MHIYEIKIPNDNLITPFIIYLILFSSSILFFSSIIFKIITEYQFRKKKFYFLFLREVKSPKFIYFKEPKIIK